MSELRDARAGDAARTVVLAADPLLAARELLPGRTLLAPNPRAARAVRGVGVARGLHDRAARAVSRQGASLAGPMARLLALREVVAEVLAPADVAGTSRRVEPVVSELLRSGIASRAGLIAPPEGAPGVGRRSAAVARLALAYPRRPEERGAVDPAAPLRAAGGGRGWAGAGAAGWLRARWGSSTPWPPPVRQACCGAGSRPAGRRPRSWPREAGASSRTSPSATRPAR